MENLILSPDVTIIKAFSAQDALGFLLDHDFALALLDVQMPEISGFELAQLMRSAAKTKHIPIIFITASETSQKQIFEGYEKGAVDYLLKPVDPHIVRTKVRVFVDLDQKSNTLNEKLEEMAILRQLAEDANRSKSRFLANMSHEIRTPLGAIIGFAELLTNPDQTDDDNNNSIHSILRNGQLLLQIVNDILDLSKIEAEKIDVDKETFQLTDILSDLTAAIRNKANAKGIVFHIEGEGFLPVKVNTDQVRLKQILYNVIGNAIKFTERGQVSLSISYNKSEHRLSFRVKDTGTGLTESEASRIFQPFAQGDSSTSRKYGGTGLGLVISKELANLLGGDVSLIECVPNVGSTFLVTIDAGAVSEMELKAASELSFSKPDRPRRKFGKIPLELKGVKILVADDTEDNRSLLKRVLTLAGAQVKTTADGEEVISAALEGDFDIILMDIQMPKKDGYEATKYLRSQNFNKPIIALTACAMKDELDRALSAGCNQHLSKPINPFKLIGGIVDCLKEVKSSNS